MKLFHILGVVLMALCFFGCSSGSSGAPASGGNISNDTVAYNLLDTETWYTNAFPNIAVGDDAILYVYLYYYDEISWNGIVDIVIDYEEEGALDTWVVAYNGQMYIEFDDDGNFEKTFTFEGMEEGTYNFRVTVGNTSGSGRSLDISEPAHDLTPYMTFNNDTDTSATLVSGETISLWPRVINNSDTAFYGQVHFLIEYNFDDAGYETIYDKSITMGMTPGNSAYFLINVSDLPIGSGPMRLTISSSLDTTPDNNQYVTGTVTVTGTHDLSASLDCRNPDSAIGDVIHFPVTMYNNSDTVFDGNIRTVLELNNDDEGYETYYDNISVWSLDANGSVLWGVDLIDVPIGEYAARFTISNPVDTTPDNNIYYYSTVTVSPAAIIAPVGNN